MRIDTLTVKGLSKRYGAHRALAGVDLTVRAGKLCALLGANGAGKSTLLGILSTLIRPSAGSVVYSGDGTPCVPGDRLRRRIGLLAHDSFLYGELSGLENLLFYGRLFGLEDPGQRARAALEGAGLDERAWGRPARTYSRGMVQRLALARALVHDPEVLLFDEPFTGLDGAAAAALVASLGGARASGRLVLVVTHDVRAIAGLVDHVAVLRRGRLAHDEARATPFDHGALANVYEEHLE